MLRTPYDVKFKHDGTGNYLAPASLRGVPIQKITETCPYWENTWDSLDEFLEQESAEKANKEKYQAWKDLEPENTLIRKRAKLHSDNMSKHVKIREIFGAHSSYHPNQIVSKRHMEVRGFCQKEIMYRIACKVSDLKVLNDKGDLTMDAWDFIRWRIDVKLQEMLAHPGQNVRNRVRSIIFRLCDDPDGCFPSGFEDHVMREAVLLSAGYQNRLSSFGGKRKPKAIAATQPQARSSAPCRARMGQTASSSDAEAQLKKEIRKERRRQVICQPAAYLGVNAFRARQTGTPGM